MCNSEKSETNKIVKIKNIINDDLNMKLLEQINNISSNQKLLLDMVIKLDERIKNIENRLVSKNKIKDDPSLYQDLIELKVENIVYDNNDAIKALFYRDFRSILIIFRSYYKCKTSSNYSYPIRIIGKRTYEYYLNGKWIPDPHGHYSMKTICNNIQNLFIKVNDIDNKNINQDNFLLNQEFIYKLSDEKTIRNIFKSIIEELRINN